MTELAPHEACGCLDGNECVQRVENERLNRVADQQAFRLTQEHAENKRLRRENELAANELVEYAKLAAAGTAEQQLEIQRLSRLLDDCVSGKGYYPRPGVEQVVQAVIHQFDSHDVSPTPDQRDVLDALRLALYRHTHA